MADEITRLAAACDWRSHVPRDEEITCISDASNKHARDAGVWSEPPPDVLSPIMCRLPSFQDPLGLAAVCRGWHAAVRLSLPYSLPKLCLALPDGRFLAFQFQPGTSVLIPRDNLSRVSYRGASSSELLCDPDDCGVYSLVNPFTLRKMLLLPVPSGICVHEHDEAAHEEGYFSEEMPVRKLVVRPEDGLVAAIVGHERSARVALCNPEVAWSWSLSALDPWRWYADMVFFDGKLYALTNDEDLLALEVAYDGESGQPRISHVERVIEGGRGRYTLQDYSRMRYLVVRPSGGGLLMVCKVMLEYGTTTYQFLVFQADLQSSRWVEVGTLGGDEALFVGRLYSRAVPATSHGVRGDRIFFLDDAARMQVLGLPLGDALANVYDMKDGTVSELLPVRTDKDGAVPATWLFRSDAEE